MIYLVMHTRSKGLVGEDVACTFLIKNGFSIISRNYQKKWGEIDIIAQKDGGLHFFEVKSVSVTLISGGGGHRPEDNVHGLKRKKIGRMIETYLVDQGLDMSVEFGFHVLCVFMDINKRIARVKWIKDVIL
jgi:putative endonuclease